MAKQNTEQLQEQVATGRQASMALLYCRHKIESMTTEIMQNAVAAQRSGELNGERAQVAWGKVSAIWGILDQLEDEVAVGEGAARTLAGPGQPAQ
jgi:hypothetical protein